MCGLGLLSLAAIGTVILRHGTLLVAAPAAAATTAAARCPDFALEDEGVCLPLRRATGARPTRPLAGWVPPTDQLSAFELPWKDAPVAPSYRASLAPDAPAVLMRTRVGSRLRCATALSAANIATVESGPEGTWLLTIIGKAPIMGKAPDEEQVTLGVTGTGALDSKVQPGLACHNGVELGTSGDALVFFISGVPPGGNAPSPLRWLESL